MGKFINPFTDVGFKRIFGQEISKPVLMYDENVRAYRDTSIVMEGQYMEGEKNGLEKGLEKGRAEGRAEERLSNARSLLKNGVPMELLAKSLKLTEEEQQLLSAEE